MKIIMVGGGGHCISCIDVIEAEGKFKITGIVVPQKSSKDSVLGYPVIGSDADLVELVRDTPNAIVSVGQIKDSTTRVRLYSQLKLLSVNLPIIVSPRAYRSNHANVGEGTIVMHGAMLNAKVMVGVNCIINSMALLEHDVKVGDHCHVSTGARINGGVKVGNETFIGSGSVIKEGLKIGDRVVIGAGEIIRTDISSGQIIGGRCEK